MKDLTLLFSIVCCFYSINTLLNVFNGVLDPFNFDTDDPDSWNPYNKTDLDPAPDPIF